jgi:serine/threonine-protein kinase
VKTQTHALMGTPLYMAPEQCRGAGLVDARSDVYALGCVLFALIAGRPPFVDEGTGDLIIRHVMEPAPRVTAFAPHVQANVEALIARCLEKDPARRFSSATELATALGGVMSSISDIPHIPQAPTIVASETTLGGAASQTSGMFVIGRRAWWIAALAVAAVAVGCVLALRGGDDATPDAAIAPIATPPPPDIAIAIAPDAMPDGLAAVVIRLDSQPQGAQVFVAGQLRGITPLTLELTAPIEVVLVRAGFLAHRETVDASSDRDLVVVLKSRSAPPRDDSDEIMKPVFGKQRGDGR